MKRCFRKAVSFVRYFLIPQQVGALRFSHCSFLLQLVISITLNIWENVSVLFVIVLHVISNMFFLHNKCPISRNLLI